MSCHDLRGHLLQQHRKLTCSPSQFSPVVSLARESGLKVFTKENPCALGCWVSGGWGGHVPSGSGDPSPACMTSNADTLHSSPSQHGWWGLSSGGGDLFYFCLRLPPAPSPQQVFPGGPMLTAFPVWAAGQAAGAGELCGPLKAPLTRGGA